jgi:nucleoside-diphosphate-sugar epimerase
MSRPLVDVCDAADAMIMAAEAPAARVSGEIFNVVHSNYQIRELAMLVAGSVQLAGRQVSETAAPALTRDYECSNAKLADRMGFIPARSVVEAVSVLLATIDIDDRAALTDPRHYNIRWMELLHEAGSAGSVASRL